MNTIILVDDHEMLKIGLKSYIEANSEWKIIGTCKSISETLLCLEKEFPDLFIIDIDLDEENGFDLVDKIRNLKKDAKIIMYSMHTESNYIVKAKKANINGYISKSSDPKEFLECINKVFAGENYLEERFSKTQNDIDDVLSFLSKREIKIFLEMLAGESNEEISKKLNLTKHTIEVYATNIYDKTFCKNRSELLQKYQKPH